VNEYLKFALEAAFIVGFFWAGWRRLTKDVNGLGRKVRRMQAYLTETASQEERRRLTDLFKD
jgi:hypothetical protein